MASSLYQPRPVVSSNQRYPHAPDFIDTRRSFHAVGDVRSPLRESNGNSQSPTATTPGAGSGGVSAGGGYASLVSCYQSPMPPTPTMLPPHAHTHAQPPMVPSQSFDCLQRLPAATTPTTRHQQQPPTPRGQHQPSRYQHYPQQHHQHQHQAQQHHHHQQPHKKPRHAMNPLYFWPTFRQYRNRQAHKDTQKDKGGVWRRPELEDAFVDSVLLMPHMGRRKFSMGGKLHGRNMLISEYIFVICVAVLGDKEIFRIDNSNDSIEQMGRKQVSSHMQVVKKFFEDLRCFHFLFPAEEKREPGTTNSDDFYEEEEQESFKSNPVLTALAEGRVPDVKPNYEYFSQLLALQSSITVRPKTCEIFVSSPDVKVREGIAYDAHDQPLDPQAFPHLNKYMGCDDSPNVLGKDVLLHEYTRAVDRTTSACVRTVTRRWQRDAPAMYETLDLPQQDDECLLLEMCATVELHEHARFPSGSELTGFVEVAVTQPALQNHRWKCVTRLTRPQELRTDEEEESNAAGGRDEVYTNESGIHRRGCAGDARAECDCHLRGRSEIHVPFPAVEWAGILSMAVQYPDHEHRRKDDKKHGKDRKHGVAGAGGAGVGGGAGGLDRSSSKRKRSEDEGDASAWARREPSGSDLICRVAMYQELWSCAPDSRRWTRQAIIFWRFNTTNQWYKYNPVFRPAGTTWRWLTVNDPMSRYHQQKALVYPSASTSSTTSSSALGTGVGVGLGSMVPREAVMSPTPSVSQHLAASMSEQFSQAWGGGGGGSVSQSMGHSHGSGSSSNGGGITFLDTTFSSGLVTPPPSASLPGSYSASGSFDGNNGFLAASSSCGPDGGSLVSSSHPYFDGTGASAGSGAVHPYLTGGSLDLSSGHGGSHATHGSHSHGHGHSHSHSHSHGGHGTHGGSIDGLPVQGWDMSALDGWQSAASASTPVGGQSDWIGQSSKMDSQLWNAVHWGGGQGASATNTGSAGGGGSGGGGGGGSISGVSVVSGEGSPGAMKRRRTETFDSHAQLTGGWQG